MADGEGHDMDQEVPEELPMPNDVNRKMKINDKVTLQHRLATAMRKSMGGDKCHTTVWLPQWRCWTPQLRSSVKR